METKEDADDRLKSLATRLWGQWDETKEHPSGNGLRFYREGKHLGTVWRT